MSRKLRSGQVGVDSSGFSGRLSVTDDDVQKSFETLDTKVLSEILGGTDQSTYAAGDILYSDIINSLTKLPIGTNGFVLKSNGYVPEWGSLDTEDAIDIIRVGKIDVVSPNTTVYLLPDFSESNNEDFIAYLIDGYGTLSNFNVVAGTAPGGADSIVFTVRVNNVDTSLSVTLAGGATTITGINSIVVSPDDIVTVRAVTSATCAASDIYVSIRYGESLIGSDTVDIINVGKIGAVTANSTKYLLPNYAQSATEVFPAYIFTQDGYINNLKIHSNTAPGAGETAVITLRNQGADTLLTATVSGATATAEDLVNIISVNSGDKATVKIVTSIGCAIQDVFVSMKFST